MQIRSMSFRNKAPLITLFTVIVLGVSLRLYHLGFQSLWADELATWWDCWQPDFSSFWRIYTWLEMTPPLYFLIEFFASRVLPNSESAMRLTSLFFGIGFMFALAGLTYELSGRKRSAFAIGAALAATSYRAIYVSQEARCYALLLVLAALSSWAWLRVRPAEPGNSWKRSRTYVATTLAMCYTHYFGILMSIAHALSVFYSRLLSRSKVLTWTITYLVLAIGFVPWIIFLTTHAIPNNSMIKHGPPLNEFFVAHRELFGSSALNSILALVLAIVGIVRAETSQLRRDRIAVLSWVLGVFLLAWSISLVKPIYSVRYFMVTLPAMLAAAAVGAVELFTWRKWVGISSVILFSFFGLYETIVAREFYSHPHYEQVRESTAAALDLTNQNPKALLAVAGLPMYVTEYYIGRFQTNRHFDYQFPSVEFLANGKHWPDEILSKNEIIVVLYTYDPIDQILAGVPTEFTVASRQDFNLGAVFLLKRRQTPVAAHAATSFASESH